MNDQHTSEARITANRQNAARSTGPRSAEGKEISKFNSLKHGLSSQSVVLRYESQEEYAEHCAGFIKTHSPLGSTEEALVKEMANASWKLRRLELIESEVFDKLADEPTDVGDAVTLEQPHAQIAAHLLRPGKAQSALNMLARYQATLSRQFHQSLRDLRIEQDRRKTEEREKATRDVIHEVTGLASRPEIERRRTDIIAAMPNCLNRYVEAADMLEAAAGVLDPDSAARRGDVDEELTPAA